MLARLRLLSILLLLIASSALVAPGAARAGEPSLQSIFDGALGSGCVDAGTDNGNQTFPAGTYRFTFLAAYTDYVGSLGWAPAGDDKAFNTIFGGKFGPGSSVTITIPVTFGLRLQSLVVWSSENAQNLDKYDHFWAFAMCGAAGSLGMGFEDVSGGGDGDHQDFVFTMEPATRQTFSFGYNPPPDANVVLGPGAARSVKGTFIPLPSPSLLTGGDLDIEVVENPPGCGAPTVNVSGFDFEIVWPEACFDFGEDVVICLRTDKGPLEVQSVGLYGPEDEYLFTPKSEEGPPLPLCGSESEIDCSGAVATIASVWPPNHELVPVSITGVTSTSGNPITITVTGVSQDEPVNGLGDGDACPDAVIAEGAAQIRAERAGNGNGRVYEIAFIASDGTASCEGTVTVCVPHDKRSMSCVDDGQTTSSTEVCPVDLLNAPRLKQRRPSPGSATPGVATVEYSLPIGGEVSLGVYDIAGRRVATLAGGVQASGDHAITWSTAGLSSGVYFYRLRLNGQVATRSVFIAR